MSYQLYLGDCLEILPTLPAKCVDTVVIDPPYFLPAAHYNVRSGTFRSLSDLSILSTYFRLLFGELRRVLSDSGFCYAFCDGQSYPVFYAACYEMFRRVRPLVWDKQTSINGYGWRHQHELILFCESTESPHVKTGDGDVLRCRAVPIGERQHLAEKPVELLRRLIQKVTPENGTVLDSFMGSGATGIASHAENKNFIGVEQNPTYYEIAQQRLATAGVQPSLLTTVEK